MCYQGPRFLAYYAYHTFYRVKILRDVRYDMYKRNTPSADTNVHI